MELRWHGHSFFSLVAANGRRLVIDPFFRVTTKRAAEIPADLVLVTHAHGDHASDARAFHAPLVAVHEVAERFEREGAEAIGLGTGGSTRWNGLRIWCVDARHSSSFDMADGAYGGSPCGFVIDDGETRFYHAGDTGLFGDMRTIVGDLLEPHVAALPIGDHYTMGPEHAAKAVEWLRVGVAIPMHYDTFPAIRQDPKDFERLVGGRARIVIPPVDGGIEVRGARIVRALDP